MNFSTALILSFLMHLVIVMGRSIEGEDPQAVPQVTPISNTTTDSVPSDAHKLVTTDLHLTTAAAANVGATADVNAGTTAATTPLTSIMETKCECAVFNTEFPTEKDVPILTHSPFNVGCHCDSTGEEHCRKLCSALAESVKERGPQLLCFSLGHYNKLKASVHSRICGANQWTYTGLTAPTEICCHEHQVIDCNDQAENQTINQI